MEEKGIQKKINIYIVAAAVAVVAVIAVILALTLGKKEETYRSVKIIELGGVVTIDREEVGILEASNNMNLISGDTIQTEQNAYAVLQLDSDKYVMLAESGSMTVVAEGDEANSRTAIRLETGSVLNEIQNPLSSGSSYDVVTPSATMSVRGTVFEVRKNNDNIEVLVYDGTVAVGFDGKEPVLYEAGEYTQFTDEENPRFIIERTEITEDRLNDQILERLEQIDSQSRELNLGAAQLASAQTRDESVKTTPAQTRDESIQTTPAPETIEKPVPTAQPVQPAPSAVPTVTPAPAKTPQPQAGNAGTVQETPEAVSPEPENEESDNDQWDNDRDDQWDNNRDDYSDNNGDDQLNNGGDGHSDNNGDDQLNNGGDGHSDNNGDDQLNNGGDGHSDNNGDDQWDKGGDDHSDNNRDDQWDKGGDDHSDNNRDDRWDNDKNDHWDNDRNHGNNHASGNKPQDSVDYINFWQTYTMADYEEAAGNSVAGTECSVIYYLPHIVEAVPETLEGSDYVSELINTPPQVYKLEKTTVGSTLTAPQTPAGHIGYNGAELTFAGWYLEDGTEWKFKDSMEADVVKADICLYPVWQRDDGQGGVEYYYPVIVRSNSEEVWGYYCNSVKKESLLKDTINLWDASEAAFAGWEKVNRGDDAGDEIPTWDFDEDKVEGVVSLKALWSSDSE